MSYESLQQLAITIRGRRTIKMFEQRSVDPNIIKDAIEVARWAPNHHLTEPWHFYLLNDDVIKRSIDLIRIIVTEKKGEETGNFKAQDAKKRPG